MSPIVVLNGPNLNLLGVREPTIYGSDTLDDIADRLRAEAVRLGIEIDFFQSNAEHELVERLHTAFREACPAAIINPGALTHTSIALRDAFLATRIPFIEVHLSNVHARETFRRRSYLSDIARGVICGLGPIGYSLALQAAVQLLKQAE